MPDANSPRLVSSASVQAILAAAGWPEPASPEMIDGLQEWLGAAIERATWRANEKPLTHRDIATLRAAYDSFASLAASLRHRQPPPPRIDEEAWQIWFAVQDANRKRGRPDKCD